MKGGREKKGRTSRALGQDESNRERSGNNYYYLKDIGCNPFLIEFSAVEEELSFIAHTVNSEAIKSLNMERCFFFLT